MEEEEMKSFLEKPEAAQIKLKLGQNFDVLIKCLKRNARRWAKLVEDRPYDAPEVRMESKYAYTVFLIQEILLNRSVDTAELAKKCKRGGTFDEGNFRRACNYVEYRCEYGD